MIKSIMTAASVVLIFVILTLVGQPAHAEDQRPCVSKTEFYGARDFGIPLMPDVDAMSKVPYNPEIIGRIVLETKWDMRHRGVTVTETLNGNRLTSNPIVKIKMYEVCDAPLKDLQVYVFYNAKSNLVLATMLWSTRMYDLN